MRVIDQDHALTQVHVRSAGDAMETVLVIDFIGPAVFRGTKIALPNPLIGSLLLFQRL